jgi:hypothetical protein
MCARNVVRRKGRQKKRHAYKYFPTTKFLLFGFIIFFFSVAAEAQVVVDVSKITCDQFATYKVGNPEYIAIWLERTITALAEI